MATNLTTNDPFQQIKERVVEYQERRLDEYGDSAKGVDWKSREAQELLFRVIRGMGINDNCSVLDVGCGLAHFYDSLLEKGFAGRYTGIDLSARMIEQARVRHPELDLRIADILRDPVVKREEGYDFVTACGVFSLKIDASIAQFEQFTEAMIEKMYELCRVGTIVNMLTKYVDFAEDRLYYADPAHYLRFAKTLTRFVNLKHDYPAYFFTLALYRAGNEYESR
jgi:SAM-dependent methyltransferase